MSVWDHKDEVIRWVKSPEGMKVWCKKPNKQWVLVPNPQWYNGYIYIVDDRHAKMRMEWIDKGKPQLECSADLKHWRKVPPEPIWNVDLYYRFKKSEWNTPEGEDPIAYHAKRLKNKGGRWHIVKTDDGRYLYNKTYTTPVGAVMMEQRVAMEICNALNRGELQDTNFSGKLNIEEKG